jgi:hypothetical protein
MVSRGEFEMLARSVTDNARRLDAIDQGGTRGVAIVTVQLTDLAKDVARLGERMDQHEKEHVQDALDRKSGRRWLVGTLITAAAGLGGVYALLVDLIAHMH